MRFNGIHFSLSVLASLGLVTLSGCGGGDNDSASFAQTVDASKNTITQIALTEETTTVHVQGSYQFKVNGLDAEGKVIADLTNKASWKLSDSALGSVNNGLFKGKGTKGDMGEVKLTVSYAGIVDEALVKLTDAELRGVTVSHDSPDASVDVCKNTRFNYKTLFSDDGSYDYPLTWKVTSSTQADIASFPDAKISTLRTTKSGVIKVVATGKDSTGKEIPSPEFEFTINQNLLAINLTPSETIELRQGQTRKLSVRGTYKDGSNVDIINNASLKSSNENVLKVSATGEITAVSGSATGTEVEVTASCDTIEKKLLVKVTKPEMEKIEIIGSANTNSTESLTVSVGAEINPRIKVTYPSTSNLAPEVYGGTNSEWTFTGLPTGFDQSALTAKVNADGEVEIKVKDSLVLTQSVTVTLNTRLFDSNNKTIIGTAGSELKDSIQLTINR